MSRCRGMDRDREMVWEGDLRTALVCIGPPLLVTAVSATLAHSAGIRGPVRRLSAHSIIAIFLGTYWVWLPRDPIVRFLLLVLLGVPASLGNLAAFEHRLRHGRSSLASYLADVLTLSSRRLTRHLSPRREALGATFLRGVAFGGVSLGVVLFLRKMPDDAFGFWAWQYFKLMVFACAAQALSDIVVTACGGAIVPFARMPMLATSYEDFWGRRYNLWVHGFLRWFSRDMLGLSRRPVWAVVAAFLVSGCLHEYLTFCVLGAWSGCWMAFWCAQLLLTLSTMRIGRLLLLRRSPFSPMLGAAFLHVTMLLTSPLFFGVLDRFLNFFGPPVRLW